MKQLPFIKTSTVIKGFNESQLASTERNDCVVRSISVAFSVPYEDAHKFVEQRFGRKFREGTKFFGTRMNTIASSEKKIFDTEFKSLGNLKYEVTIKGKTKKRWMTVGTFVKQNPVGTFIILVKGHAFSVIDGHVIGNYQDSTKPKRRIYNVWEIFY
jgi:hypothetical protein